MGKFASGLLNYVESVNINGVNKTAFYSEFATNLEVGDKVFIINGNYDSDKFISSNNFSTETDGYTILSIDKCRIVLDIEYTGLPTYNQDSIDNYIKIYHIQNQQEFDYVNNITINTYNNNFQNKFEYGLSNNIIFTDTAFSGSTNSIFGEFSGVGAGFYQKQTNTSGISNWLPVNGSPYGLLGTSSIFFITTGGLTYSLINNSKLLIIGEDIITNNITLKSRGIYTYTNKWTFDISSIKPYISKLNFRKGKFNGSWNDGVFGTYVEQTNWYGNNAIWNSGIFINSNWNNGLIKSKSDTVSPINLNSNTSLLAPSFETLNSVSKPTALTINSITASRTLSNNFPSSSVSNQKTQNYYAALDVNGLPTQTTDFSNNSGYGFNYFVDSNVHEVNIYNGNFINCNIGLTNYGINTLDVYYGLSFSYLITSNHGLFRFCDINTSLLSNSNIANSNIINSNVVNSRLTSNQIKNTVASGVYNSDDGIKILKADLWSYTINTSLRGVLKLFISDSDLLKLQNFEVFYIKRINKEFYISSFDDETKVWLNLENKYILDYFNNNDLSTDPIIVSRKNSNENRYKVNINYDGINYSNNFILNSNPIASIDIDLGSSIYWYKYGTNIIYANSSLLTIDNVNTLFTNTDLCVADFNSGIATNMIWESGDYINDNSSKILNSSTNLGLELTPGLTNSLVVKLSNQTYNKYDTLNEGDYIWLNGIDYIDPYSNKTTFSGTFKVENLTSVSTWRQLTLTEITNNIYGLTFGGTFSINNFQPNYISVNKFKIENSTIESGLFKTPLILNSTVYNKLFNNTDQNLNIKNISSLRFINTLLKDDNNIFKSGYVYKSHVINTTWDGAISFNNIFYNQTFNNGILNNSYWLNGIFNDGFIINSDDIVATTASYDDLTSYYRSWRNGIFNSGQFYNSIWLDGTFNNGRFYNSTWYGGIWNNGILGLKNSPYLNTKMSYYPNLTIGATQTLFYNGIVESAIVGGNSNVNWYNGSFNSGEFTSFGTSGSSIWYNGIFNGGKFDAYAKWKNGTFNNGKFLSIYGYTLSNISHYSTAILYAGYSFSAGNTFSIVGGDNNAYGIVNSVSTGSGLTLKINAVGNITGSGFIIQVGSVSAAPTYSIVSTSIFNGGTGYTSSSLISFENFDGTSIATGVINATPGGSVSSISLTNTGFGFSASATYSTIVYSGPRGPILDLSINDAGTNYVVGDFFTISNGTASGIVTSVGLLGNVTSITLSSYGSGYTHSSIRSTSLDAFSKNHISSYTILNRGTNYVVGNYGTLFYSGAGIGFTISITSTETNITVQNCSWENGIFNGGQFGSQVFGTNSSWFNGTFNGGSFYGKFWNFGVFTNGQFYGSGATAVYKNESNFVNSFANNYYGIWLDGIVIDEAHLGNPSRNVVTPLLRASDTKKITKNVTFKNMLWLGGTFSHSSGTMDNSAWLDGSFNSGNFNNSSFNPFIDQTLSGFTNSSLFSFNLNNSCVWNNGNSNNSAFYISKWYNGVFNTGYMLGGIWKKGTWLYGTAENIYWESGTWKNGNWYGTNFGTNSIDTASLTITDPKVKSVIYNVASYSTNTNIHLMNVFTGSSPQILRNPFMSPSIYGWTFSSSSGWAFSSVYSYSSPGGGGLCIGSPAISANNYLLSIVGPSSNLSDANLLYGMKIGTGGGLTTSIFTDIGSYTVKIKALLAYTTCIMPNPSYINLHVGFTVSSFACTTQGTIQTFTKTFTNDEIYLWTNNYTNTKLGIGKRSSNPGIETLYIFSVEVNRKEIFYNKSLNNKLYNIFGASSSISLGATLSLPSLTPVSDIGVPLTFGNGTFYSGIWENGVWNTGYRKDDTLVLCDLYSGGSYIKVDKITHRLQLQLLNNSILPPFKVGDYVSVGNVIAYDLFGNRKLLKDKFRVVFVDRTSPYDNIVLEYILTTPISSITKDSENHLIYVSKNIWMSGAFLSGYFTGIWNYGLFKGFPYITEMNNSHLIDGIFDGGRFISRNATASNLFSSEIVNYNTGLIQNFNFKDNNIANPYSFTYQSWIDANYVDESQTNLYQDKNYYDVTEGINTTLSKPNLNGFITYDVLSSISYFKNGFNRNGKNYSLGVKYKKYVDYLQNIGTFDNLFSNTTQYSSLGMNNFITDGWTISSLVQGTSGTSSWPYPTSTQILYPDKFTINNIDSSLNIITTTWSTIGASFAIFPYTSKQNYIMLNNSNTSTIPKLRYSLVEYTLLSFTGFAGPTAGNLRSYANNGGYYPPAINFVINPATWSLNQRPANALYSNTEVKREYFYNRRSLLMQFVGGGISGTDPYPLNVTLDSLSFYEVDMIPFFQYTTESNIDQTVRFPYTAIAPYIDYTNANYNYIGNIQLNITSAAISRSAITYNPAIFSGFNFSTAVEAAASSS